MQTFRGHCHCQQVTFEATLDPASAMACNCSICTRVAALRIFVPASQFKLLGGAGALTDYQFGRKHLHHTFCKMCGIHPFASGKAKDGTDTYAVNANCLEGLDTSAMKIQRYDGKSA